MDSSAPVVVLAACAGAAVCAGVYVLCGSNRSKNSLADPGLINLGNTCFLNALLQALAAMPSFKRWLVAEDMGRRRGILTSVLQQVLTSLVRGKGVSQNPSAVLRALRAHGWVLSLHQQQDVHELYLVLISTLEEENDVRPCLGPGLGSLSGISKVLEDGVEDGGVSKARKGVHRHLSCPMLGLLRACLVCVHCSSKLPMKYECFYSISLTVPAFPECSLQACLKHYMDPELVCDVECPQCSKVSGSKVQRSFLKQFHIARLPECLCFHLQRTSWLASGQLQKNNSYVSFPFTLDMSKYLCGRLLKTEYVLVSVVEHRGEPWSGHFVTFRKTCGWNKWISTSDTQVLECSRHAVQNTTAYMLFYQRTASRPQLNVVS